MTDNDVAAAITPAPVRVEPGRGVVELARVRVIVPDVVPGGDGCADPGLRSLAAELLEPAGVTVTETSLAGSSPAVPLELRVDEAAGPETSSHPERYTLTVTAGGVVVAAPARSGLLHGLRTLAQIAGAAQAAGHPGEVTAVVVHDAPRYGWRGLSLDIARHFFGPDDLRAVVDLLGRYKMNRLGLHLTDDQGWRLEIPSRPDLVARSSQGAVNGDPGGYLGVDDYAELQEYAAARGIVVVPEIDLPGHVNAATHAYGELNPDGRPTDTYEGIEVGFSRLYLDLPATEPFLRDVLGDVARMTHGEWVHFGGDEVHRMETEEYLGFVELCQEIVASSGKTPAAWQEAAGAGHGDAETAAAALAAAGGATAGGAAALPASGSAGTVDHGPATAVVADDLRVAAGSPVHAGTVLHYWDPRAEPDAFLRAAEAGARFVMAPAERTYLDMKYTPEHPLGLQWAGFVELRDSYEWDPAATIDGLPAESVDGVSACVWTETLVTRDDLFSMLLPRLAAVAETAWTPQEVRNWESFRSRIATEAAAWRRDGVTYHPTPQVDW
ncbi:family 20 glycosylhydrolase [Myceligenerans pegani]|uniref:beta-N-acetylhexosaminidase n=1 Tax=Myceligenerans pegani TaxID=2776917 RepID=A0ABR9MTB1_9MICO|nr:family 20 glycosylhydrolase [Myceligenerans sp. TRM 65318]MBE1874617.1 family 20 glycosylhydrolase [Myceligenerans sp. TRM 65318]MBE3016888.1 family 20 glycosylhydrolase [Myceligenerans sp. TRM 65318]